MDEVLQIALDGKISGLGGLKEDYPDKEKDTPEDSLMH